MLREFGKQLSPQSFEKEEDQQTAQVLIILMAGAFATCFFTILGGFYWKGASIVQVGCLGLASLIVPFGLYVRKNLNAASFFVGFNVLIIVTLAASLGQGIHDIGIMAYPVVILVGSLIMHGFSIVLISILSTVSIAWLIYAESAGILVPRPTLRPSLADFLIMASILVVAGLIVNLQTRNMRNNLKKARLEIVQRKAMEEQLRYLGTHDILTGVYNRLYFDGELSRLEKSTCYPISIIVADLDNLKKTNDALGHSVGDQLLKRASSSLRQAFRTGDILARIGGDEFAVLLPSTDEGSAREILARLQAMIDATNSVQPELNVQLSFGAATVEKGELSKAFTEADRRMYKAKSARKARGISAPLA
jgi:diguanylate cyclase (GGDEF)-like protein